MFGYRSDGKRLKRIDPIIRITSYIMKKRYDSQVEMVKEYIKSIYQGFENSVSISECKVVVENEEMNIVFNIYIFYIQICP